MSNNEITTKNSQISGGVAGENIYNQTFNRHHQQADPDALVAAIKKICELEEHDEDYIDFVDAYEYYLSDRTMIGLEQKLKNGNRDDLINEAIDKKDYFSKALAKGQLGRRKQYLYYYILQKINSAFDGRIRPLIKTGVPPAEIDELIYLDIISPIHSEVVKSYPVIDERLIYGMLYYLTGRCHLVWEK